MKMALLQLLRFAKFVNGPSVQHAQNVPSAEPVAVAAIAVAAMTIVVTIVVKAVEIIASHTVVAELSLLMENS
jgi:hypothetical protein